MYMNKECENMYVWSGYRPKDQNQKSFDKNYIINVPFRGQRFENNKLSVEY